MSDWRPFQEVVRENPILEELYESMSDEDKQAAEDRYNAMQAQHHAATPNPLRDKWMREATGR